MTDIEDQAVPAAVRARPWSRPAIWASAAGLLAAGFLVAVAAVFGVNTVPGSATANPVSVMQAAQERKEAQAALVLKMRQAADQERLQKLQVDVRDSMQEFFSDPANNLADTSIKVFSVGLFKTSDNTFEGMATMSAFHESRHDISVHVRADDTKMMWSLDPGALMPLFR